MLTKQQAEDLKVVLNKVRADKPLTANDIVDIIEEISKPQRVRQGGHFIDQKLEYTDPAARYLTLFDLLSPKTKEKIEHSKIDTKTFGIRLTPAEDKLINAIFNLLHYKSENQDAASDLFYAGNEAGTMVPYGGNKQEAKSVFLRLKPAELYKEYVGDNDYSGKEIENIKNILYGLCEKKFLIVYDRVKKIKNGNKTKNLTDRIEEFQTLVKIISYFEDMTDAEVLKLDNNSPEVRKSKGELIIALNPILTDQIKSKYVVYPTDISKRTVIASGGPQYVTESIITLRDYMLRELSNKRYKCEINADTLPFILKLDSYIKSHRKKLVSKKIEESIRVVKNLGILLEVTNQMGKIGQQKYVFILNSEFV
jgi:hypothetical protein